MAGVQIKWPAVCVSTLCALFLLCIYLANAPSDSAKFTSIDSIHWSNTDPHIKRVASETSNVGKRLFQNEFPQHGGFSAHEDGTCTGLSGQDLIQHVRSADECTKAAMALQIWEPGVPPALPIASDVLPYGCYYKAHTATYYANFLNKSADEYKHAEQRLYFNSAGQTGSKTRTPLVTLKPQHPSESHRFNSTRVSICRNAKSCPVHADGRTCDDWIQDLPLFGYSCENLRRYGLTCDGCSECQKRRGLHKNLHDIPCGEDRRVHCRFEKSRHSFSQYSADANSEDKRIPELIRVVAVGDTHGRHEELGPIPPGDIFIHTGDFTSGDSTASTFVHQEIAKFDEWLHALPHPHKFFVCGNHDADGGVGVAGLTNLVSSAKYLLDTVEGVDLDDDGYPELRIWGSPWQPQYEGFDTYIEESMLYKKWEGIAKDADIVVTHTPSFADHDKDESGRHVGSKSLQQALKSTSARLHIFGHIHTGREDEEIAFSPQRTEKGKLLHVNVAAKTRMGHIRSPIVIDVPIILG